MAPNFLTMSFDIVTIRVGTPNVAVNIPVYREVVSAISPYFRKAFEGRFKEATERFLTLTDVSEQTFRIFLQWAHMQAGQHSNGVLLLPPGELLRKSVANIAGETSTSPTQSPTTDRARRSSNTAHRSASIPTLHEPHRYYEYESMSSEEMHRLCWKNPEWLEKHQFMLVSFLRLYILADKYDVPQLRDDILTALIAQSQYWEFWSNFQPGLVSFAYENLPSSSKFIRLLAITTAYIWLTRPEESSATKLRELKETNEEFAFDVTVVQADRCKYRATWGTRDFDMLWLEDTVPHSCVLHEHLVLDEERCRKRIRDHPYVFTTLVYACVQDALGMAQEGDKE